MTNHRPARRYARALYSAAVDSDQISLVAESMALLLLTLREHPRLARYLADHRQPNATRCAVIRELLQSKASVLVDRFCALLATKRRLGLLQLIAGEFADMDDETRGIINADVIAAHPITDDTAGLIKTILKPVAAHELRMKITIDDDLLAGVRIKIGDMIYDASLAARLRQAGRRLAGAVRSDL